MILLLPGNTLLTVVLTFLQRRHDQSAHIEDEPNPVISLSEGENVQKCKGCTLL